MGVTNKNKSTLSTIRAYCIYCNGEKLNEVLECDANGKNPAFNACPFHPYRMGRGRPSVKIIREFCLQCMGGRQDFVRECETADCLCHPFRMGKNPNRVNKGYFARQAYNNKAQKQAVNEGFAVSIERTAIV